MRNDLKRREENIWEIKKTKRKRENKLWTRNGWKEWEGENKGGRRNSLGN